MTLDIIDKLYSIITRAFFPYDKLFKETVIPAIKKEITFAEKIVFMPEFDRDERQKKFISLLKDQYQFGNYSVNGLYDLCRKPVREEYKKLHQDLCHLLYD